MAGLLQRRLIGPIWKDGAQVTDVWLGDPEDPPAASDADVGNALKVTVTAACASTLLTVVALSV